jgi:biotin carboxylase
VLSVASKYKVDGVVTEQTDVAVLTAAYVAEKLGLPGIGYEVGRAATNKWLMRERCRKAGISGPQYRKVQTLEEAVAAAHEIGLPVVIKPVDAQSSRGVAKIWDIAEIPKWFAMTRSYSREGSVLIEEMMTGPESSVETFIIGDRVIVLGICDKAKCPPPYSYDVRLTYPGFFSDDIIHEITVLNEKIIKAIGITMGITHAEYIVTTHGVRFLEIAARGCGARVATDLIPAMTGIDPIAARIRQAVGEEDGLAERTSDRAGVLEFLMLPPGRVNKIEGVDEARRFPGVLDVGYNVSAGDRIGVIENGEGRPGYVLAVGETRADVLKTIEQVKSTLRVEMETAS